MQLASYDLHQECAFALPRLRYEPHTSTGYSYEFFSFQVGCRLDFTLREMAKAGVAPSEVEQDTATGIQGKCTDGEGEGGLS